MNPELLAAVRRCAGDLGLELPDAAVDRLAGHAEDVLHADATLHLTSIRDVEAFVARHVGESLQGAALIDSAASGTLLDLGSGNGYPGLALSAARPGLAPVLAEVSVRKAAFLTDLVGRRFPGAEVLAAQVQRPGDLDPARPLRLLVTRAMGGWERVVPRLISSLAPDGEVLIWAGRDAERVLARGAWRRLELVQRVLLAGRERSWIWHLRPGAPVG